MALIVRRIARSEFREFFSTACASWDQSTIPYYTDLNLNFLTDNWERMMGGAARAYGLFDEAKPVGALLGLVVPDLMTGEKHGIEYLWAVSPEFRKGRAAFKLLKYFENDCRNEKCARIIAGSAEWSSMCRMTHLYERLGYHTHSVAYSKAL